MTISCTHTTPVLPTIVSELLLKAVEQAADSIVITDIHGLVEYANPVFQRVTGYAEGELIGRSILELHADDSPETWGAARKALQRGDSWSGRLFIKKRDGTTYQEQVAISPIHDESGTIEGFVTIRRDISEEVEMESRLRQAQRLESVGRLAAGIAHEINTPMQYVGDNTRFLQDCIKDLLSTTERYIKMVATVRDSSITPEFLSEAEAFIAGIDIDFLSTEIPEAIRQSLEGIDRVTKIVRAMKEFSHPSKEEKSATDLNRAIETTVTIARNEWKYAADVVMDFDDRLPLVPCLPGEFNQVMLNLIVNSAHAIASINNNGSRGKGTITIRTRQHGSWAEIQVADTGCGIPDDIQGKIFDPFFTTKGIGKGTGQGLSIARSVIVEKHNGSISLESKAGQGTRFTIKLPLNAENDQ